MKKSALLLFIIVFMFLTKGSYYINILEEIYIASYYLSYEDGEYNATFYANDSALFGKQSDNKPVTQTASFKGENLSKVFQMIEDTLDVNCNFRHVESVIFDVNFFKEDLLEDYFLFIKNDIRFDYNFYIFATDEDISTVYGIKNPDSSTTTEYAFNSPDGSSHLYLITRPIHYTEFVRNFYAGSYIQRIPMMRTTESWTIDDKLSKSVILDKVYMYGTGEIYTLDEMPGFVFLGNIKSKRIDDDNTKCIIVNYKNDLSVMRKFTMTVKTEYKKTNDSTMNEVKEYIEKKLKETLDYFYDNNIDILNIKDINYRYKKNYSYEDLKIKIKISE